MKFNVGWSAYIDVNLLTWCIGAKKLNSMANILYHSDVTRAVDRLKPAPTTLFVHWLVQANINIKSISKLSNMALYDWWIPLKRSVLWRRRFHAMAPWWETAEAKKKISSGSKLNFTYGQRCTGWKSPTPTPTPTSPHPTPTTPHPSPGPLRWRFWQKEL